MSTKNKVEREENWYCDTCGSGHNGKPLKRSEAMAHLENAHKVKPPFKGKREMIMHIDSSDSYSSTYNWTIAGVKLTQALIEPRYKR